MKKHSLLMALSVLSFIFNHWDLQFWRMECIHQMTPCSKICLSQCSTWVHLTVGEERGEGSMWCLEQMGHFLGLLYLTCYCHVTIFNEDVIITHLSSRIQ